MHSSFSIRHFSPTLDAVLCRLAPEHARSKRPTPPDVVLLLIGDVFPAVAAQLVVTVGDVVLAEDALRVQEDLAQLAVVTLFGNDGVVAVVSLR